jgi:hypothetical protein
MRREKERDLAVGEAKYPRNFGRKIIASAADQNPEWSAAKGVSSLYSLHASMVFNALRGKPA